MGAPGVGVGMPPGAEGGAGASPDPIPVGMGAGMGAVGLGLGMGLNVGPTGSAASNVLSAAQQRMFSSVGVQWRPGLPSSAAFQGTGAVQDGVSALQAGSILAFAAMCCKRSACLACSWGKPSLTERRKPEYLAVKHRPENGGYERSAPLCSVRCSCCFCAVGGDPCSSQEQRLPPIRSSATSRAISR
jgi:hypothetical protein